MAMKTRSASLLLLPALMFFCGHAFAQCAGATFATVSQLNTVLPGHYACGRKSSGPDAPGWNEQHVAGGSLVEQHEGGSTVETVGTWTISGTPNGDATITYVYTGGQTDLYKAVNAGCTGTGVNATCPFGTYTFCGVGGSAPSSLQILISSAAPSLSSCPSN